MKISNAKVGMQVYSTTNPFKPNYIITKVNKNTVDVDYITGDNIMRGGKWIPEVFNYTDVDVSILEPIELN